MENGEVDSGSAARDLGRALGGREDSDPEPLTVFLGSGASRSSGAPDTSEVEGLLGAMFERFGGGALENLHRVDDDDRSRALRDRFEGLVPYLGYRCLAILGRSRRVLVINANWDPLLQRACQLVGVPCHSFDLRDESMWPDVASLPDYGVIDVHFHGGLSAPRHGAASIQWQTPAQVDLLQTLHQGARRLYVGLSLDVDHDLVALGAALDHEQRPGRVFGFFRDEPTTNVATRVASLHGNEPVFVQRADVDFDRVMLILADTLAPEPDQWVRHEPQEHLPTLETIVLPRAEVVSAALDDRFAVLLGEAQIGKTTTVHLIGYLHHLLSPTGGRVRYVDEVNAPAALGSAEHEDPADLLVLESPFGEGGDDPTSASIATQIEAWAAAPSSPRLVITSRVGPYVVADLSSTGVVPSNPAPSEWYDLSSLAVFGRLQRADEHVADKVRPGWLDTPARIKEALAGMTVRRMSDAAAREREAVDERCRLFERDETLALAGAIVRLSEFGSGPPALEQLKSSVPSANLSTSAARLMLVRYRWDGRERVRLRHALDRAAIDQWMDTHRDEVRKLLDSAPLGHGLAAGWQAWVSCQDARQGRFGVIESFEPAAIGEHLGAMLRVAPGGQTLALADVAEFDEWSAHDFAYSLLRMWEDLPVDPRRRALARLIGLTDAVGAYGVLEACLYLGAAAPAEALDAVHVALWEMLADPDRAFEVALCLDGFAWRVPPETDWVRGWAREALERMPVLAGVLPVLGAYHYGGTGEIRLADVLNEQLARGLGHEAEALTLALVRWHFVHQSRARAMLAGQPWLDKAYLCRSFLPPAGDTEASYVRWLLEVLAGMGEPGWAFFSVCFLMGGLEISLNQRLRDRAGELLDQAAPRDPGVIAAAATYTVAADDTYKLPIRRYFADIDNRNALLDTLSQGLTVEGFDLVAPRFVFWGEVPERFKWLSIKFPRLAQYQPTDLDSVLHNVRRASEQALAAGTGSEASVKRLLSSVAVGDFRILETAALDGSSDIDALVVRALVYLESDGSR